VFAVGVVAVGVVAVDADGAMVALMAILLFEPQRPPRL
jgi:hypothetical protein